MLQFPNDKKLNREQLQAIRYGKGPLLIIAGAGTGKTTVVTERIRWLISEKLAKPSEILALTFTQKAAREMEERVDILMPYGYTQMWISTFHSFCDRILRQETIHIGLNPAYKLLSDTDVTMLLRRHLFELNLDYFRPLGNPTKFIGGMIDHFSRLRDEDITPPDYKKWIDRLNIKNLTTEEKLEVKKYKELSEAYEKYQQIKIKDGAMDFGDLINNTLLLFRKRKNILKNYQEQFKFILVDEFQDTNIAQNELLLLLASHGNITAVADDDQSIYKFRGAAVSNVISFRKNFPKAKLIVLSQNYRSTQEILDKSYRLIQFNNPDRLEVKEGINKKLTSTRKIGEPVKFIYMDRVENEAEQVTKEINKLHKDYQYKDFAILVRANNHAEPFVRALQRHGIPFQFLGPGQLFRQGEIKDLISYLQVISNLEDNLSLYRIFSMEYFDISPRDLVVISSFSKKYNLSLFEGTEVTLGLNAIDNIKPPNIGEKSKEKLTFLLKMINRHLKLLTKETAGQILYYFLEDTGMIKNILNYKFPLDEKKAANISKFFNKLKTYEAEHEDASVGTVLDWILLSMEIGESPLSADIDWADNDAVNILTIHSAKGLEFKIIFLVNLVSQRFPTSEKKEQIPIPVELIKEELPEGDYHLEEERRLFYVGMTRACDILFLTASNYYGEGKREKKMSPFLYESLGDDIVRKTRLLETNQLSLLEWHKNASAEKKLSKLSRITYLSFSQIDAFRLCPLHYKLRYILNILPPTSPALSFGSSIHNTLKDFYLLLKNKQKATSDILLSLLDKNWLKAGYTNRAYEKTMYQKGKRYLKEFFAKEFNPRIKTLVLEQPFNISILTPDRTLKVGGRIDRIDDLGDGKIEIIDYKTGRLPSKREVDANLQLSIYAIAATDIAEPPFSKKVENITLSLYYFDKQQKISTIRTAEQLKLEKEKIIKWAEEIEASDFKCSGKEVCRTCEYKMFCGIFNSE